MPSLSSFWAVEKPFEGVLDDEGGDAARARRRVGLGIDDERLGKRAVGDPHFRAVEHVTVAVAIGARAHRHHVGTGIRLRHRQRADMLAGNQLRQIALLLLGVGVAADLIDAEIRMRDIGQADRRRSARNLLDGDALGEIAHAGATPLLFDRNAEKPKLTELRPQLARKLVRAVDLVGTRRDLCLGKRAHRFAQHVDVVAKAEIEAGQAVEDHRALQPSQRVAASGVNDSG